MDIRLLSFLVLISIAGSLADLRSPFRRVRRNGLREYDRPGIMTPSEVLRPRRETVGTSTTESVATPKSTVPSTSASTPSTDPPKKPSPTTKSKPTTASTPEPSSTTGDTPKPSPKTKPTASKPESTTPAPATKATTTAAPKKPKDSDKDSESSIPSSGVGSRINLPEDEPKEAGKKPEAQPRANLGATGGNPIIPGHPSFSPNFAPSFFPDYSSPYNPYGDPTFNSIPGPGNYAWSGNSNGGGGGMSFASASSSSGGYGDGGFEPSLLSSRGAFGDEMPKVVSTPYLPIARNPGNPGGYANYGVDSVPFDTNSFAFPGYDILQFQKQMEENFRQLQNQFQQQQKMLFETANRIGADPNAHSAVSSINLGPGGGYQSGAINPVAPGIQSRFGEDIPPPSGNSYGVFSSSSSKTVLGPDGKPISHKVATTGVNDNGKITFRTVEN